MAISKLNILFLISILFTLSFTQIKSDDVTISDDDVVTTLGSNESDEFKIELDKLTSKIEVSELLVHKKSEELRTKDDVITEKEKEMEEKEKLINEKSDRITSLKTEVASLKVKGSSDAKEQIIFNDC